MISNLLFTLIYTALSKRGGEGAPKIARPEIEFLNRQQNIRNLEKQPIVPSKCPIRSMSNQDSGSIQGLDPAARPKPNSRAQWEPTPITFLLSEQSQ